MATRRRSHSATRHAARNVAICPAAGPPPRPQWGRAPNAGSARGGNRCRALGRLLARYTGPSDPQLTEPGSLTPVLSPPIPADEEASAAPLSSVVDLLA